MAIRLGDAHEEAGEIADINVTPFIDVTLVLLIIFMVAAPLSTVDVAVDLPVSNAQVAPRKDKPIFLSVRKDLSLALGEETVPPQALGLRLDGETGGDHDRRIFLRADQGISYGDLMGVMNRLRAAGYLKIALVGLEDAGQGASAAPAGGVPAPGAPAPQP